MIIEVCNSKKKNIFGEFIGDSFIAWIWIANSPTVTGINPASPATAASGGAIAGAAASSELKHQSQGV